MTYAFLGHTMLEVDCKDLKVPEKASIIIIHYNQTATLELTLAMLNKQTNKDFELIITDDGSSLAELSRLHRMVGQYDYEIRVVCQQNQGARRAHARNQGVRLAKHNVLIFLDADVVPDEQCVGVHLQAHKSAGQLIVYNPKRYHVDMDNWQTKAQTAANLGYQDLEATHINATQRSWELCWSFHISMTRSQAVMFDEDFIDWGWEDTELAYRLEHQHQYQLIFEKQLVSWHVTTGKQQIEDEDKLWSRSAVRNALYFINKYPNDFALLESIVMLPSYRHVWQPALQELVDESGFTKHTLNKAKEYICEHAHHLHHI